MIPGILVLLEEGPKSATHCAAFTPTDKLRNNYRVTETTFDQL